ncbi:MAG: FHA domain-containing protein [Sedimentisphaerales bacterium]|nr:FHA domain-containing protein [Sedimentisphaerales bacterium]
MHLIVKQSGRIINEFRFDRGPIYIGRHAHSQILLPDLSVSRQHAAIFCTQDGKWMVEDMDSANKTYLNGSEIRKAKIKTGDSIRIADFIIEIDLETQTDTGTQIHLEDTLFPTSGKKGIKRTESAGEIIIRKPDAPHSPDIRLPAGRINDFINATEEICKANGPDETLKALLDITTKQFDAYHTWCALRNLPEGRMTSHAGKCSDGRAIELKDIKVKKRITEAVDKGEFVLLPQVATAAEQEKIRSAIIAPVLDPSGCFGVLYVDNAMDHQSYSLSDLDYLMLIAIHTAAIIENF